MSFTSILFQQTIRNYLDIFTITICYIKIFLATSNIVHSGYCGLAKSRLLILLKHRCWNKVHGCRAKSRAHATNFLLEMHSVERERFLYHCTQILREIKWQLCT